MRVLRALSSALLVVAAFACSKSGSSPDDGIPLPDRGEDSGSDQSSTPIDSGPAIVDAGVDRSSDAPDGSGGLRVFITSTTSKGRFGGVAGADTICNNHAKAANLPGTFVAWVSVENGPHAVDRLTSPGPWTLVSGELVAVSKAALLSGTLAHAIDHDEKGVAIASQVWTGSGVDGRYLTNDCDKWTNGNNGRVGLNSQTNGGWTSSDVIDCDNLRRLYCFQL